MEERKNPTKHTLKRIAQTLGLANVAEEDITAFTSDEDGSAYAVWRIDAGETSYVLKRAKAHELEVYRAFFREPIPYVPAFLKSTEADSESYFLTEFCPGEDLRVCDRERLTKALDALIALQETFWERKDLSDAAVTEAQALKGIENRGKYLNSALLERAYAQFVALYKTAPRTLCHDDLLPINVLVGERAVLIDWEYGGILPYPTSFARLIAHGREDRSAYFYMTRADRDFAIAYYYEHLVGRHGISYEAYRRTLDGFLFYEYCEWIMLGNRYDNRGDERFGYYSKLAEELAPKLIENGQA